MGQERENNRIEIGMSNENGQLAKVVVDSNTISNTLYMYDDEPDEAITIDATAACEEPGMIIVSRTFSVIDTYPAKSGHFTMADVDVGLNLAHTYPAKSGS